MVSTPIKTVKTDRPKECRTLYSFKDVTLEEDGFKFEDITEFNIENGLPTTKKVVTRTRKSGAMNDIFIVYIDDTKRTAIIFLKDNIDYTKDKTEVEVGFYTPTSVPENEFKSKKKFRFYKFVKILENKIFKIRFEEHVTKVLLNGEQIIFMTINNVCIFTPFSSNVLFFDEKPVDIALCRHLYILAGSKVFIYGEKLISEMKFPEKLYRFVVPATDRFFLIKKGTVYKVIDGKAEIYFVCSAHIQDCVYDDRYMYIGTSSKIIKLGMYEKDSVFLRFDIDILKLCQTEKYLIVQKTGSSLMFIDKNDFSRFSTENLGMDMCSVIAYKNTVGYIRYRGIILFEFEEKNGNLVPIQQIESDQRCDEQITSENVGTEKLNTGTVESNQTDNEETSRSKSSSNTIPHDFQALSKRRKVSEKQPDYVPFRFKEININTADEIDEIYSTYAVPQSYRSLGSSLIHEKSDVLQELLKYNENIAPYQLFRSYEIQNYKKPPENELNDIAFELADNPFDILDNISTQELIASPETTQKDTLSQPECTVAPEVLGGMQNTGEHVRAVRKLLNRLDLAAIDDSQSSAIEEMFFDEPENSYLQSCDHLVLKSLMNEPQIHKRKIVGEDNNKDIPMKNIFKAVLKNIGCHHPVMYSSPIAMMDKGSVKEIKIPVPKNVSYTESFFFIKNHFEFFKKRFQPRSGEAEEKPLTNGIYNFVDEEFRKIVGYVQPDKRTSAQKTEIFKKKGGF